MRRIGQSLIARDSGYAAVLRARQCRRGPDRSLHRRRVTRIWRDFWSSLLIAVAARRIAKKGQDAPDRDRPQLGAPDDDGFRSLRRMPHCMRKAPGDALQISEYPVAPFGMEPRQRSGEIAVVINVRAIIGVGHWQSCPAVGRPEYWSYLGRVLEAFQGVCRGQYRRTWRLALHKNPQFDRGGTCSRNAEVDAAA